MTTAKGGRETRGCFCCLGATMRALSRVFDSACDLYVRGITVCASRGPSGFARSATTMHRRPTSDRAASKQRRITPQPEDVGVANKKVHVSLAPAAVPVRRKVTAMTTIAEDAPCEFGVCVLKRPEMTRRGAAVGGLAARGGGFGAI